MIEIKDGETLLAVIAKDEFPADGIRFVTSDELSQQLGFMAHPKGRVIDPNPNNQILRQLSRTRPSCRRSGSLGQAAALSHAG